MHASTPSQRSFSELVSVVTFVVDEESFAFSTLVTREVIDYVQPRSMPGAPTSIHGVINLRGEIVPVCDLGHALGLRGQLCDEGRRRIVVAEVDEGIMGFSVDEVHSVSVFERAQLTPPGDASHRAVEHVIVDGHDLIVVLRPGLVLAQVGSPGAPEKQQPATGPGKAAA